jgi:hypothetical protein
MNASKNSSKTLAKRELTHSLIYSRKTDSWSCKCGYVLGQGHGALYALCPQRESLSPNADKLPTVGIICGSFGCKPVKKTALDLFDLAPPNKEEKLHGSEKKKRPAGRSRTKR